MSTGIERLDDGCFNQRDSCTVKVYQQTRPLADPVGRPRQRRVYLLANRWVGAAMALFLCPCTSTDTVRQPWSVTFFHSHFFVFS
jgi:hypothetical protein